MYKHGIVCSEVMQWHFTWQYICSITILSRMEGLDFFIRIFVFFAIAIVGIAGLILAFVIGFGVKTYNKRPKQNNQTQTDDASNEIENSTALQVGDYFTDFPNTGKEHATNFSSSSKDTPAASSVHIPPYYVRIFAVIFMTVLRVDKLLWHNVNTIGFIILILIIPFALYISNRAIRENNVVLWEISLWVAAIIPLSVITSTIFW